MRKALTVLAVAAAATFISPVAAGAATAPHQAVTTPAHGGGHGGGHWGGHHWGHGHGHWGGGYGYDYDGCNPYYYGYYDLNNPSCV